MTLSRRRSDRILPRREDILVSVCLTETQADEANFLRIMNLARMVDGRYRFWELVLIVDSEAVQDYLPLVQQIANLRLIEIRHGVEFYRRNVVAASEAIGDVVVLAALDEMDPEDITAMIEKSIAEEKIIFARRCDLNWFDRLVEWPLAALGRGAGYAVNVRNLQTCAFPRTLLNVVLNLPDRELALRFPPGNSNLPLAFVQSRSRRGPTRSLRKFGRQSMLLEKLLVNLAPRFLTYISLLAGLLALMGISYAIYTLGIWAFNPAVEPGWLSTSFILSLTAFFLGITILGLSLGLKNLLGALEGRDVSVLTTEIKQVDLIGQVARELNVEIMTDKTRHKSVNSEI